MKQIFKYVMILMAVLAASAMNSATVPIKNGFLQSDFNGNQFSFTNVFDIEANNIHVGTLTATNLDIFGTNFGITITTLPLFTVNNPWDRFPFANTNSGSNGAIRYDALEAELAAQINPSFPFVIVTNGSSTATIQSQFNSLTNGGVVQFQPGTYTVTTTLTLPTNG